MMIYQARAAAVLYNFLLTHPTARPYLLPANVCWVVPLTFLKAGIPFEFVDISPQTLCLDMDSVLERTSQEPNCIGGVLFVHSYGAFVECEPFFREVKRLGPHVRVIDDRCAGMSIPQDDSDSIADLTLFSTGYAKIVELKYGGFGVLGEDALYRQHVTPFEQDALTQIEAQCKHAIAEQSPFAYQDTAWLDTRPFNMDVQDYHNRISMKRQTVMAHKQRLNEIYAANLPTEIQLPRRFQDWRFHILVPEKPTLLRSIFEAHLFASSHYPSLVGIFAEGVGRVANELASRIVNLFNDHYFDESQAYRVVEIVNAHTQRYGAPTSIFPTEQTTRAHAKGWGTNE